MVKLVKVINLFIIAENFKIIGIIGLDFFVWDIVRIVRDTRLIITNIIRVVNEQIINLEKSLKMEN